MSVSSISSSNSYQLWLQSQAATASPGSAAATSAGAASGSKEASLAEQLKQAINDVLSGVDSSDNDEDDPLDALRKAIEAILKKNGIETDKASDARPPGDATEGAGASDGAQSVEDQRKLVLSVLKSLLGNPEGLATQTSSQAPATGLLLNVTA